MFWETVLGKIMSMSVFDVFDMHDTIIYASPGFHCLLAEERAPVDHQRFHR